MPQARVPRGMEVGPGRGSHRFRIRQQLVRDNYAPLIAAKSYGAVKLDLLLRCIALNPADLGARKQAGIVLRTWSFENLHDLIREEPAARFTDERDDDRARHLKRKWVADQLSKLRDRKLLRVEPRPGRRPEIVMLRDDGSQEPFDDPGQAFADESDPAARAPYLTINGGLIGSGEMKTWTAAELAAYSAALTAELHHPRGGGRGPIAGHGTWYRPLDWFSNGQFGPTGRILLPFSVSQLKKGLASFQEKQLIRVDHGVKRDPRNPRKRFGQRRNIYHNLFDRYDDDDDIAVILGTAAAVQQESTKKADERVAGAADA